MVGKRAVIYQRGIVVVAFFKIGKALCNICRLIRIANALNFRCGFFKGKLAVIYALFDLPHIFRQLCGIFAERTKRVPVLFGKLFSV